MAKQTVIKQDELINKKEACELLNVSSTTLLKFIKNKQIRRVKDKAEGSVSYIYKPDVEEFLANRFYFEGEE